MRSARLRSPLPRVHVEFEAVVELQKALDAERRQKEGHGQSGGIDGEKEDPLPDCVLRAANPSTTARMGRRRASIRRRRRTDYERSQAEELPFRLCKRVSASRALIWRSPVRCRPNRMMTAPAMRASRVLYCARTWPTSSRSRPA